MPTLWGSRFTTAPNPAFAAFDKSLPFDRRLHRDDIRGSIAWSRALAAARVLTPEESGTLILGLEKIARELDADPTPLTTSPAEDIHSFVESRLRELVGDVAGKLHTGRSRNDQIATDLKLHLRAAADEISRAVRELQRALVELADRNASLPIPGYTHMQRAQPITAGHHALAYVEMLERDRTRIADARARMDACPLGSGALAGTAYPIDRDALARDLGFARATANSLDAVSDRDHAAEIAFACSLVLVHLSRLAEDWIFFASREAGFLELSDAVATGSSLMPQKKNPDALELVRGKCGRVIGRTTGLLCTLKGLPLAYDKDLQEDKEAVFECVDTTLACVEVTAIVARNVAYVPEVCVAEARFGQLNATDLADLLVAAGLPFRTAHERTGTVVRAAIEAGVEIEELPVATLREMLPELAALDLARELSVEKVLARRDVVGGTAPLRVLAEVQQWKKRLA